MKDKVFIIWSGNNLVAKQVKLILEQDYNYLCFVGGSFDESKQMLSIGDTVIHQMNFCNQAIVIFQNKTEGNVSNNLFFELGFVVSEYGMRKVHCVRQQGEKIELPSDFDNSFVEEINAENKEDFARKIVDFFMARQKLSVFTDKMELISQRYRMHDLIQAHYSETGSKCSDYELAQYILFYMQSAVMFQDDEKVLDELLELKKRYNTKFSKEINQAILISISLLKIQSNLISENDIVYISDESFRKFFSSTKNLLDEIEKDDSGIFDEWANVILAENIAYACSLYSQNPSIKSEVKKYVNSNIITYAQRCIGYIEDLEKVNNKNDNNDEIGLIAVFKAYLFRHLYVAYQSDSVEEAQKWLSKSLKEWKCLLNNFGDNSIDSKLYENFEMEYYLTLIEYLSVCNNDSIDEFERRMLLDDIDGFISKFEKRNNAHAYIKKIIAQRDKY